MRSVLVRRCAGPATRGWFVRGSGGPQPGARPSLSAYAERGSFSSPRPGCPHRPLRQPLRSPWRRPKQPRQWHPLRRRGVHRGIAGGSSGVTGGVGGLTGRGSGIGGSVLRSLNGFLLGAARDGQGSKGSGKSDLGVHQNVPRVNEFGCLLEQQARRPLHAVRTPCAVGILESAVQRGPWVFCLRIATSRTGGRPDTGQIQVIRVPGLGQDDGIQLHQAAIMTATDIDRTFPAHLATITARTDDALAACGFDALVIFSGRPPNHFLDDAGWPFKVNPHFKLWAPLTDAPDSFICHVPGRRPVLCFYQPADYWHRPPQLPVGRLAGRIRRADHPRARRGARGADRGARSRAAHGVPGRVARGIRRLGLCGLQSAGAPRAPALLAGRQDALRARMHALRVADGRTRTPGGPGRVLHRRIRVRGSRRLLRGERAHRGGAALSEHHRLQRGRGHPPQPSPRPPPRRAAALLSHRCRSAVPRLRIRHHAHVFGRRPGVLGADRGNGCAAAAALRLDPPWSRLSRSASRGAPHDRGAAARMPA